MASVRGLDWQNFNVPFVAGLRTKDDPRAMSPPGLSICRDVEFDDLGGLRLRKPYTGLTNSIIGGGSLADFRKIVANGDELVMFTVDSLYSYQIAGAGGWVKKGTHLAIATAETDRFDSPADQYDADRAELSGVVMFAWVEGTTTPNVYVAAIDKSTGAVLLPRTVVGVAPNNAPRLVALQSRILMVWNNNGSLVGISFDPLALSVSGTTAISSGSWPYGGGSYDIVKVPGQDLGVIAWEGSPTTSYHVATILPSLAPTVTNIARTCDSAIAVAVTPDGQHVHVIRTSGTRIRGDLLTIALADVVVDADLGSPARPNHPVLQIAAACRSVKDGGQYRCYVYWESQTTNGGLAITSFTGWNWMNDAGTVGFPGTEQRLAGYVTPAARAFTYAGHVFVWTSFAEASSFSGANNAFFSAQLQNTYFLYRDDGLLCGKAATDIGAGPPQFAGRLPGVSSIDGLTFRWCGGRKRRISLGSAPQTGYSAERAPREISMTFDSNDARRAVRLGNTLYITGAEILQYDGVGLNEVGFHTYPWRFFLAAKVAAGNMAAGTYAHKMTWRWSNAQGELDRSTTATVSQVTINGTTEQRIATADAAGISLLCTTHKTTQPPAAEVWRTTVNPTAGSPFYLATATDPDAATPPNQYLATTPPTGMVIGFEDNYSDAAISVLQTNPENGAVLPNLAPPPATIMIASADRLFLAGVAGDPHRVWYSKLRGDGEVCAFNDGLAVAVPPQGGVLTGLGLLNETLIAFRQHAIYALAGDGFDNLGGGSNYGPARLISSDVGAVNHESIALTPEGLIFKSSKGWYLLDRGWGVKYVGAGVDDFDADTVVDVRVVESQHQVRCLTSSRLLVYDYYVHEWSEWTVTNGLSATMWRGVYTPLGSDPAAAFALLFGGSPPPPPPAGDGSGGALSAGANLEAADFSGGVGYGIDVETGWIKVNDLQGFGRVRYMMILGEYRGDHHLRVRVARNYQGDGAGGWAYFDDNYWTPSPVTVGGALQVRHAPSIQKGESYKVRITASSINNDGAPPITEALKLTGLALQVGVKRHLKSLPVAQKGPV